MQIKQFEMQHQLWETEQDMERKLQVTALEEDDVRSLSTEARDKSPLI